MKERLLKVLTLRGHTFMPGPLSALSVVVDLGANEGEFARAVVERFGCRCIAVEANPRLAKRLRGLPGIEALWCAVGGREGETDLFLSEKSDASTVLGDRAGGHGGERVRVPMRRLWGLLAEAGVSRVDLLKLDIEGSEIAVLESMSDEEVRRCGQITVEFHDFCGLVSGEEIRRARDRLAAAGFAGMRFGRENMNWLFVRRGVVGPATQLYVNQVVRRARAAARVLRGGKRDY